MGYLSTAAQSRVCNEVAVECDGHPVADSLPSPVTAATSPLNFEGGAVLPTLYQ